MPKPNYAFAKRQRELATKQKKEAKKQEKAQARQQPEGEPTPGQEAAQGDVVKP